MEAESSSLSLASLVAGSGDSQPQAGTEGDVLERALLRAQTDERGAFEELVYAHQSSIYSLALRLLRVREDAQELAQDVFMLLHRHLATIRSVSHLRFWLRRTTCHRAIDRRRREKPTTLPLDAAVDVEMSAQDTDPLADRLLLRLIAELPLMPRAVVLLRYQEDLDPPEIARLLGLSLNTVKSHLRRSLILLRGRCGLLSSAPGTGGDHDR